MAMLKVLVPYNFTGQDQKALDFVCRMFLNLPDVSITLLHLHPPMPDIPVSKDTVMDKMRSNMNYLLKRMQDQEADLRKACSELVKKGFSEKQVSSQFEPKKKDLAAEIIDKAHSGNFEMIVLNRNPGRVTRFFATPVHAKVVAGVADKTVSIVS